MARIKNWKVTRRDKHASVWQNQKTGKIVAVQQGFFNNSSQNKWDTAYATGSSGVARKIKAKTTKTKALEAAKSYMKKNINNKR